MIIGRIGKLGKISTGGRLPAFTGLDFALNPANLSSTFGVGAEALTGLGNRNVLDYAGVLQSVPSTLHRMAGGRLSGGMWYDTDGSGNPITPYAPIDGAKVYTPIPDLKQSTAYVVGDVVNVNGQELECVQAGTTGATVPLDSAMPTVGSPELITNGDFSQIPDTYWQDGINHPISTFNGSTVTVASPNTSWASIVGAFTTTVGKDYVAMVDVINTTPTTYAIKSDSQSTWGNVRVDIAASADVGSYLSTFNATVATSYIHLLGGADLVSNASEFDNVSVKEALVDGTAAFISKGAYKRDFGVLVEDAGTNAIPATNWRTAAMWGAGWGGGSANNTIVQQTNGDLGIDGLANKEVIISDVDVLRTNSSSLNVPIANDTATHTASIAVRKNSSAHIPCIQLYAIGGTGVTTTCAIDTVTGEIVSSNAAEVSETPSHWIVSLSLTNNGTGNTTLYMVISPARTDTLYSNYDPTLTGSVTVDYPQIELNQPFPTSPMAGGTTRTTEMGAIKWASDGTLSSGDLTRIIDWCPQFASGDLAAGQRKIAGFQSSQPYGFLYQGGTTNTAINDGSVTSTNAMPAWSKGDCIRLAVRADLTNSLMYLDYRNISNGDSFTHVAAVAYDGAFTDTGFYQYLKAGGGNNSIIRNDLGYNRFMETTELEALYG